ncbi:MAG: hypothetical protein LBF28_02140 [Rickettsiales bacterium]|nr:hypothetical protein [Rickettsiales bacterium]
MIKSNMFLIALAAAFYCSGAIATICMSIAPVNEDNCYIQGCSSLNYYGDGTHCSCDTCISGYTRTNGGMQSAGNCDYGYYYCQQNCTGCSNCNSDADWSAHSTGYQKKVTKTCSCNTCNSSTSYRCASGYYGSPTTGTSGCTQCPTGGTSNAGASKQTDCYASPVDGTDTTGNWKFTETCYYS